MEQGFLNQSARFKNKEGHGLLQTRSRLAEMVTNIDGKILGKDGKPLRAYRSGTFRENIKDTSVKTGRVDAGVVNVNKHDNRPAAVHSHVGSNQLDDGDDMDSHSCNMPGMFASKTKSVHCEDVLAGADVGTPEHDGRLKEVTSPTKEDLSALAISFKKFNAKALGNDGKPLKAYRSCTFGKNIKDRLIPIVNDEMHIETECLNQQTTGLPHNPIPELSTPTKKCNRKETQSSTETSCARDFRKWKAEHTPPVPLPSKRRNRLPWTKTEEEILKEGMQRYVSANINRIPWKDILDFGRNVFHKRRTTVDLKDKWRNMQRRVQSKHM